GRSGVLLIGSLLLDTIPDADSLAASSLLTLGERVREELAVRLQAIPPILEGTPVRYQGVAHGWAGFLYALLRWSQSSGAPLPAVVPERLQQLARTAEPFGRGARWKWVLGNGSRPSYMPGWCNGSAGYVFLWTQAHGVLQDERYLALA